MQRRSKVLVCLFLILGMVFLSSIALAAESGLQASVEVLGNVSDFIKVNSPQQWVWYGNKKVLIDIELQEQVLSLYYSINGGKLKRLCKDCEFYYKSKSFKDGFNNISFIAKTYGEEYYSKNVLFFVDSKKPKLKVVFPKKVTGGLFTIQYTEINVQETKLFYGPGLEYNEIMDCESTGAKEKKKCSVNVNLSEYDGQKIYYVVAMRDENFVTVTKAKAVLVDTTPPAMEIGSPKDGEIYQRYKLRIPIEIYLNEKSNLEYYDVNNPLNPGWVDLCSKCTKYEKELFFTLGSHNVTFRATDGVGNIAEESVFFEVV